MADLTITAASVLQSSGATVVRGVAGATVTRGQPLYMDSADANEMKPAQGTATKYAALGIALEDAADGQSILYVTKDAAFTPGATVAVGVVYCVSVAAAGGIAPDADITTAGYKTAFAIGISTTQIKLDFEAAIQAGAPMA